MDLSKLWKALDDSLNSTPAMESEGAKPAKPFATVKSKSGKVIKCQDAFEAEFCKQVLESQGEDDYVFTEGDVEDPGETSGVGQSISAEKAEDGNCDTGEDQGLISLYESIIRKFAGLPEGDTEAEAEFYDECEKAGMTEEEISAIKNIVGGDAPDQDEDTPEDGAVPEAEVDETPAEEAIGSKGKSLVERLKALAGASAVEGDNGGNEIEELKSYFLKAYTQDSLGAYDNEGGRGSDEWWKALVGNELDETHEYGLDTATDSDGEFDFTLEYNQKLNPQYQFKTPEEAKAFDQKLEKLYGLLVGPDEASAEEALSCRKRKERGSRYSFEAEAAKMISRYSQLTKGSKRKKDGVALESLQDGDIYLDNEAVTKVAYEFGYNSRNLKPILRDAIKKGAI